MQQNITPNIHFLYRRKRSLSSDLGTVMREPCVRVCVCVCVVYALIIWEKGRGEGESYIGGGGEGVSSEKYILNLSQTLVFLTRTHTTSHTHTHTFCLLFLVGGRQRMRTEPLHPGVVRRLRKKFKKIKFWIRVSEKRENIRNKQTYP